MVARDAYNSFSCQSPDALKSFAGHPQRAAILFGCIPEPTCCEIGLGRFHRYWPQASGGSAFENNRRCGAVYERYNICGEYWNRQPLKL
jgi:hypothetical protein